MGPFIGLLLVTLTILTGGCSSEEVGAAGAEAAAGSGGAGPAFGTVETFSDVGRDNEGLAFGLDANGSRALYVGLRNAGELVRLDPDGNSTRVAQVPKPLGIALRADGALLVCGKVATGGAPGADGALWLVGVDGTTSVFLESGAHSLDSPNFVAIAPDDRIVFTDSGADVVYVADADGGNLSVLSSEVPYPNGLAFSADGNTLWIASWRTDQLYESSRDPATGSFTPPQPTRTVGDTVDGLVAASNGDLVLVTSRNGILRAPLGDSVSTIAPASNFSLAANGAFGVGSFGERWLYVTNLAGTTISRVRWDGTGVTLPVR